MSAKSSNDLGSLSPSFAVATRRPSVCGMSFVSSEFVGPFHVGVKQDKCSFPSVLQSG